LDNTPSSGVFEGPFQDELRSVLAPDGIFELHEFALSPDGQQQTETIWRGQPNADQTGILKGTKTVTVIGTG